MVDQHVHTPHFEKGREGFLPIAIVIHIMEGTIQSTNSWFSNPVSKVSSHYSVAKTGMIIQYVEENDTAWHAGRVHNPTWELIIPISGSTTEFINPNKYTIGIEHEGWDNDEWTDSMYKSSSKLISGISKRWKIPIDKHHIIGHNEIYSLKTCPGSKVDMNKLILMARDNLLA